uniref:Cadherin related family member 2 n=1 Tax=Cynoglossus semilaevis TaxID=244447 RepID=A0A3P8WFD5_CYNSE
MDNIIGSILLLCLISLTNGDYPVYCIFFKSFLSSCATAFTINATDVDKDPLIYILTGSDASYFEVNRATGEVKLKLPLDREVQRAQIYLTLKNLIILLRDANDNRPLFVDSSYDVTIPEVLLSFFNPHVTDYRIDEVTPTAGSGLFTIVSTTGEVRLAGSLNYNTLSTFYRLKINATPQLLDFEEKQQMILQVTKIRFNKAYF